MSAAPVSTQLKGNSATTKMSIDFLLSGISQDRDGASASCGSSCSSTFSSSSSESAGDERSSSSASPIGHEQQQEQQEQQSLELWMHRQIHLEKQRSLVWQLLAKREHNNNSSKQEQQGLLTKRGAMKDHHHDDGGFLQQQPSCGKKTEEDVQRKGRTSPASGRSRKRRKMDGAAQLLYQSHFMIRDKQSKPNKSQQHQQQRRERKEPEFVFHNVKVGRDGSFVEEKYVLEGRRESSTKPVQTQPTCNPHLVK